MRLLLLAGAVCFVLPVPVLAANQFFMPGDSFFSTVLTTEVLDQIDRSEHPVFAYHRPDFLPQMLCGYAGFSRLQYNLMPDSMKQNLRQVYSELREEYPKRIEIRPVMKTISTLDEGDIEVPTGRNLHVEINGFQMLFYNADFDTMKYRMCLKYNEKWADEFAAWGHGRDHAILETFVPTKSAIPLDWRDGPLVKPLTARLPEITVKNIRVPIEVGAGVIAIVIPTGGFKKAFEAQGKPPLGVAILYSVSAEGIRKLYGTGDGHWSNRPLGGVFRRSMPDDEE
ncbi:MAG: hypothetical protein VB858_19075 [Planctomycetaceae bacterium]